MQNWVVMITGASRGLGLSLAKEFISRGWTVIAAYRKCSAEFGDLCLKYPEKLHPFSLDVASEDAVHRAFEAVSSTFQHIDLLINNAAVHLENHRRPLPETNLDDIRTTFAVNAIGPLTLLKYFYPLVEKGNRKLIFNISSEAASHADCWRESEFGYCMSKSALNMLTCILENYSKKRNIRVLSVHPGWMRTEMGGKDADIDSMEAAKGIADLADKDWSKDPSLYVDYNGKPMRW